MVNTEHPAVVAAKTLWQRCRDVAAGTDAVKARGTDYLPRPAGMDPVEDYSAYLMRAMFLSVFARTVGALAGALLRRPPRLTNVPEDVVAQLADCTMQNQGVPEVTHDLAHELLTVGRTGVLLDLPTEIEGQTQPARPYWVSYPAEDIVNWRSRRVGTDPAVLTMVVLRERSTTDKLDDPFAHVAVERFRECALDEQGIYRVRTWTRTAAEHLNVKHAIHFTASDWVIPTRRGEPLTFIPFCFFGSTGITPTLEPPPLLDLADISLSHFRNSADREHGLFYVALPTPWVAGAVSDGPLRIGPAAAWKLGEQGRAGMLEFSGAGLGAIEKAMREKELHMASLGARMLEPPQVGGVTATAVLARNASESASLRTIASSIGAGLTTVVRWHAWWAAGQGQIDQTVRVDLDTDLDRLHVNAEDIKAALLAVQADLMSFDSFYALLEQAGWARPGATAADEREAIVAAARLLTGQIDND